MGVSVLSTGNGKGQIVTIAISIASGASLSGAIDFGPYRLSAIIMPAAWDAAALTFQGSIDGSDFADIVDSSNTERSWTVAAGKMICATPVDFWALRYLKLRSGTSGTPVNQTAARSFSLIAVPHL